MNNDDAFFKCVGCGKILCRDRSTRTSYCEKYGGKVNIKRMRLTPWFTADVKPVRVGWYDTASLYLVYWSGAGGWRWDDYIGGNAVACQSLVWRGLYEPYK
jgi:hypothetical protein